MDCRNARPLLEVFVDGELSAEQTLGVEAHVAECAGCAEHCRLLQAFKHSTQRAVTQEAVVSTAFRERVQRALLAEAQREKAAEAQRASAKGVTIPVVNTSLWGFSWRAALPLAAAAAVLWWVKSPQSTEPAANAKRAVPDTMHAGLGLDHALDRLIDYHSSPPPPQVTSQELLPTFEPDVGVRVHAPNLSQLGALWEGASVVPVRNHRAAYLRYRISGHNVTVYVYDSRKVPVHQGLTPRWVHNRPVYLGAWRGYTVAAKENQGIGYALASDLDDALMAEMITEMR